MAQRLSGTICLFCGKIWSAESCKGRIRPRIKQNKSVRQLQKKYHHQPWQLKQWQRRLVKMSLTRSNRLEIQCQYCKKTTQQKMSIPLEIQKKQNATSNSAKKKAKRKKKDPSAGLFIPLKKPESIGDRKFPSTPPAKFGHRISSPMPSTLKPKPQSRTVLQMQEMLNKKNKQAAAGKSLKASLQDFLDHVSR